DGCEVHQFPVGFFTYGRTSIFTSGSRAANSRAEVPRAGYSMIPNGAWRRLALRADWMRQAVVIGSGTAAQPHCAVTCTSARPFTETGNTRSPTARIFHTARESVIPSSGSSW